MTPKATHEVHAIFDDRGLVAGSAAILQGYCSCCAPEKKLGPFPDLAAAASAVVAGLRAKPRQ
jgi:hypothetical protein